MFHLDYETYSAADLRNVGAYRYAADPSAEILMLAIAKDDGEPAIWVPEEHDPLGYFDVGPAEALLDDLSRSDEPIYAHNAEFEAAITRYRWKTQLRRKVPALNRWRCTAAMARRAAQPPSLAKCGEALGIEQQKDTRGSALIRKFCIPKKDGTRLMPVDAFEDFIVFTEYCLQDVRAEQEIHDRLEAFDLVGEALQTYQLHLAINDRGIPVNVEALENAQVIIDEVVNRLGGEFLEITGGIRSTQGAKLLAWLQERGYPYENLQALTVEKAVGDDSWASGHQGRLAWKALTVRQYLAFTATKKVASMLACQVDGRVHGTLLYHGAGPGRSSGRLVQPQNFKRPTFKDSGTAYDLICSGGTAGELELLFGNPLEALSSSIRHFIQLPDGDMLDADYAGIEARIVCWLAGQEDALHDFREYDAGRGPNAYEIMASSIFDIPISAIDKDGIERFIGKQTVLGCGFGMGAAKFVITCANFGVTIPEEMGEKAVGIFRSVRHKVVQLWRDCENAARNAIKCPGKWFLAGPKLKFAVTTAGGIEYLVMKLPSGRRIVYPQPAIEMREGRNRSQITFFGQIPHKVAWGRISTYGGKLVENATQGTAADVMFAGSHNAEMDGFEILTLIHDQALATVAGTVDEFTAALCDLPEWADGLPIVAEGKQVPYYLK